jgi:hypothetical protein
VPRLWSTSAWEAPFSSRQHRIVALAPANRRSWMIISGSHVGKTGSRTRRASGATGWSPTMEWTRSPKPLAFQSWGALARAYAQVPVAHRGHSRPRTPGSGTRDRARRDRTGLARAPARACRTRNRRRPNTIVALSTAHTLPRWYSSGLYDLSWLERVRMPHPLNMSGANIRPTSDGRCLSATMPAAMQCPALEVTARTSRLSGSIASATQRSSSTHQSRLKRSLSSRAARQYALACHARP